MREKIRKTRSLCPVCMKNTEAVLLKDTQTGAVYMEKTCPEHGDFSVPLWRGRVDFDKWTKGAEKLKDSEGENCPRDCGLCDKHRQGTCCVVYEVTKRCDLKCRFCFADGGQDTEDKPLSVIKEEIKDIVRLAGSPTIQISGGEPTLRDDLPDIVRCAKEQGCSFVQLNSNGLRISEDEAFVQRLAKAGVDYVFMQFDGFRPETYEYLRGSDLLEKKKAAIKTCDRYGIGVTLVPTVVRGVNDGELGDIVRFAAANSPAVRGVHFQPVSFFGRTPGEPDDADRYTLDELVFDICDQAGLDMSGFVPSRCDHPLCGFHSSYIKMPDGSLYQVSDAGRSGCGDSSAEKNRDFIGRRWKRNEKDSLGGGIRSGGKLDIMDKNAPVDLDTFVESMRKSSFTLTSMAFHDKYNINVERLVRCSLHVYEDGRLTPFCFSYILKE